MSTTIGNNPAVINLEVYQGGTFSTSITATDSSGNPINYTGYVAKAQIRESFQAIQVAMSFSTSAGLGPNGIISLSAASSSTVALNINKEYVWDLRIDNGTETDYLVKGNVTVLPRVTR